MKNIKTEHKKEIDRINRIVGQMNGVIKMIDREEYCIDIINQLNAVHSAIASVRVAILNKHINSCVLEATNKDISSSSKIQELIDIIKKF
jgi:DNA-binding FrmR family transcriptional regulator